MIINTEHLSIVTARNIHLVRSPNDADHVELAIRGAATLLDHHVARLDGRVLHTEMDVLRALANAFDFPSWAKETDEPGWDSTADLLWDMNRFSHPH